MIRIIRGRGRADGDGGSGVELVKAWRCLVAWGPGPWWQKWPVSQAVERGCRRCGAAWWCQVNVLCELIRIHDCHGGGSLVCVRCSGACESMSNSPHPLCRSTTLRLRSPQIGLPGPPGSSACPFPVAKSTLYSTQGSELKRKPPSMSVAEQSTC